MTTTAPLSQPANPSRGAYHLRLGGVLKSEWLKTSTVRSTWWILGIAAALSAGFAILMGVAFRNAIGSTEGLASIGVTSITTVVIVGVWQLTWVIASVLGTILMTSEYSSGSILSSLSAVPRRTELFLSKVGIATVWAVVITVTTTAIGYLAILPFVSGHGMSLDIFGDGGWELLVQYLLVVVLLTWFALGIGAMLRSSVGAMSSTLALHLMVSNILLAIPLDWLKEAARFLPINAASRFVTEATTGEGFGSGHIPFGPWGGVGITALWAIASLAGGLILLKKRDA